MSAAFIKPKAFIYVLLCAYLLAWLCYFPMAFYLDADFITGRWLIATFFGIVFWPPLVMCVVLSSLWLKYRFSVTLWLSSLLLSVLPPAIYFIVIGMSFAHV